MVATTCALCAHAMPRVLKRCRRLTWVTTQDLACSLLSSSSHVLIVSSMSDRPLVALSSCHAICMQPKSAKVAGRSDSLPAQVRRMTYRILGEKDGVLDMLRCVWRCPGAHVVRQHAHLNHHSAWHFTQCICGCVLGIRGANESSTMRLHLGLNSPWTAVTSLGGDAVSVLLAALRSGRCCFGGV